MKNIKIDELIKEIKENDTMEKVDISALCDYSSSNYLNDNLHEIADNSVDIYNYDLLEWCKNNYSYIEYALDEYGTPTDSNGKADFIRMIQQGQYYQNLEEIYNNKKEMILMYIYDLMQKEDINEITPEQLERLDELAEEWDNNDILGDLEDIKGALFDEE